MKQTIKFTAAAMAVMAGMFGIALILMILAFDAWAWEQDGHCGDSIIVHYMRDCR